MKMLTKLKWEIRILILIVLGIIGFFIYGKVREVQSFDFMEAESVATVETSDTTKDILDTLKGIEIELARANCIAKAQGDAEEIAICN